MKSFKTLTCGCAAVKRFLPSVVAMYFAICFAANAEIAADLQQQQLMWMLGSKVPAMGSALDASSLFNSFFSFEQSTKMSILALDAAFLLFFPHFLYCLFLFQSYSVGGGVAAYLFVWERSNFCNHSVDSFNLLPSSLRQHIDRTFVWVAAAWSLAVQLGGWTVLRLLSRDVCGWLLGRRNGAIAMPSSTGLILVPSSSSIQDGHVQVIGGDLPLADMPYCMPCATSVGNDQVMGELIDRFRALHISESSSSFSSVSSSESSSPFDQLSEDVVSCVLSFLGTIQDRFALQCTSKLFRAVSNHPSNMVGMATLQLDGRDADDFCGIITEKDTICTATAKLAPFAAAGNVEAMYMLGMIKCYGDCDVAASVPLLQSAASRGYVEAMYALGLVLRDSRPVEARSYLELAADATYYPAVYELGRQAELAALLGRPHSISAKRQELHFGHAGLHRLLTRRYLALSLLGSVNDGNASHCWNPLCGRWAFKATSGSDVCVPKDRVVSCMKSCTRCQQAKYCSKLCLSFDRRTRRHIRECISIRNKRAVVLYKP